MWASCYGGVPRLPDQCMRRIRRPSCRAADTSLTARLRRVLCVRGLTEPLACQIGHALQEQYKIRLERRPLTPDAKAA